MLESVRGVEENEVMGYISYTTTATSLAFTVEGRCVSNQFHIHIILFQMSTIRKMLWIKFLAYLMHPPIKESAIF